MAIGSNTAFEGMVASPAQAAGIVRSALLSLEARITKEMRSRQDGAFDHGGHHQHGGKPWLPLSPNTVALKRRLGYPRPSAPLVRTGAMSKQQRVKVTLRTLPGGGIRFKVSAWNAMRYAKYHASGFRNVWTGTFVPRRAPAELTPADVQWVVSTIQSAMGVAKPKDKPKKTGLLGRLVGGLGAIGRAVAARLPFIFRFFRR